MLPSMIELGGIAGRAGRSNELSAALNDTFDELKRKKLNPTDARIMNMILKRCPELDPRPALRRIYFAQSLYGGPVKIGTTHNLGSRLKSLNVASPQPLCYLATMPGWRKEEAALHARFAHAHVHSEWYRPLPDLMQLVWAQDDARPQVITPGDLAEGLCFYLPPVVWDDEAERWLHLPDATAAHLDTYLGIMGRQLPEETRRALRWLRDYAAGSSCDRPIGAMLKEVASAQ